MEGETIEHVWLTSAGIRGDGDRARLEADLDRLEGVRSVTVDTSRHNVEVTFDPLVTDLNAIRGVMQDAGYDVTDTQYGAARDDEAPPGV